MIDPQEASAWITAGKSALDLVKAAKNFLPKGPEKEAITAKIAEAEDALNRSDAKLAKELGYRLCQCTFPPQIMLWKESQGDFVCQNPECGRKEPGRPKIWIDGFAIKTSDPP
jgi:hypothetical protein